MCLCVCVGVSCLFVLICEVAVAIRCCSGPYFVCVGFQIVQSARRVTVLRGATRARDVTADEFVRNEENH